MKPVSLLQLMEPVLVLNDLSLVRSYMFLCCFCKVFHGQPMQQQPAPAAPHQPTSIRPRVRARRGQATDPHSIAERVNFCALLLKMLSFWEDKLKGLSFVTAS